MSSSKRWLLGGCASVMAAVAFPAFAQPAAPPARPVATNSDENAPVIEALTVTAERRSQNLQDVPIAITAFTDKVRENIGISTIQDLAQFTPGLSYNAANDRPTIRGVGRQTNNHGINSPVANYIDNVYTSSVQDTSRRPIFVDRTEILRGPQGALSGKGSSAGAINTFTKRPRKAFEAEIGGYLNNYERSGIEGTITGPINDSLRYRVNMARYKQTRGFFTNAEDGNTEGDRFGTRNIMDLMLAGEVGSKIEFFLKGSTVDYQESLHDGGNFAPVIAGSNACVPVPFAAGGQLVPNNTYGYFGPGSPTQCGNTGAFDPQAVIYGKGLKQNPAFLNPDDLRSFINNYKSDLHLDGYFNLTSDWTYHLPGVDLRYIAAWQRYTYTQLSDADGSAVQNFIVPATGAGFGFGTVARRVDGNGLNSYREAPNWYSNEVTIASTGDSKFSYVAGLYQFHQQTHQAPQTFRYSGYPEFNTPVSATTLQPVIPNARPFTPQYGQQVTFQDSYAAFGQVDYKFNDQWRVTGGLRYNTDQEDAHENVRILINGISGAVNGPTPLALDITATNSPGFALLNPTTPIEAGQRFIDVSGLGTVAAGAVTAACPGGQYRTVLGNTACSTFQALVGKGVVGLPTTNPLTGDRERDLHAKWHAVTGSIGVDYTPNEDTLVYFRYARGYRPGGFGSGTAGFIPLNPYTGKETLDSYEVGTKFTLFNKLQMNMAAFRYNYKDIQAALTRFERCIDPNDISTCSASGVTVNLPSAINQGVEVEGLWYVTNDLQLVLNYAYLDAHLENGKQGFGFEDTNDPGAVLPTAQPLNFITCVTPSATCVGGKQLDSVTLVPRRTQDLSGNPLPNAPKNKLAANINYTMHFDPGTVTASFSYIWRDKSFSNLFGDVNDVVKAYSQMNARLVFRHKGDDLSVIVYAQNLLNQDTFEGGGTFRRGAGLLPGQTGAQAITYYRSYSLILPRVYGIEILKKFR